MRYNGVEMELRNLYIEKDICWKDSEISFLILNEFYDLLYYEQFRLYFCRGLTLIRW